MKTILNRNNFYFEYNRYKSESSNSLLFSMCKPFNIFMKQQTSDSSGDICVIRSHVSYPKDTIIQRVNTYNYDDHFTVGGPHVRVGIESKQWPRNISL